MDTRTCTQCGLVKLPTEYYVRKSGRIMTYCKSCDKAKSTAWRKRNPERSREIARKGTRRFMADNMAYRLLSSARSVARQRGRECTITAKFVDELWTRQNGRCYWFDIPLLLVACKHDPQKPSLDRIDCSMGYVPGNVVISSAGANKMRADVSVERFAEFVRLVQSETWIPMGWSK